MRARSATDSLKVADEEDKKPIRSRSNSRSSSSGKLSRFTNADLPHDLATAKGDKSWRRVFCTTFFDYMATVADPWTIESQYIEDVWSVVYPELEITFDKSNKINGKSGAVVFSLVSIVIFPHRLVLTLSQLSQRLCEWRGKMWRAALAAVKEHFESEEFNDDNDKPSKEKIAAYVKHMLQKTGHGFRLVYSDTANQVSSLFVENDFSTLNYLPRRKAPFVILSS